MPKYRTVIFIHGCFWHRHVGCKRATMPKSRTDYWEEKIARNVKNDELHIKQLTEQGWRIIVLWECEINKKFDETMENLVFSLKADYPIIKRLPKKITISVYPSHDIGGTKGLKQEKPS